MTRLLGPDGPVWGNAFVHLTEKAYFVAGRVLDLLLGHSAYAASAGRAGDERLMRLAATLTRDGPQAYAAERWQTFLAASNALLRDWKPRDVREPVDTFFEAVEKLAADSPWNSGLGAVLDELRGARPTAYEARASLLENHVLQPAVEPLIPALARTVLHWSRDGAADVSIVHDEQSAMTERRVRRLERQIMAPGRRLVFRQVDSRTDPRVQVADVLAGVARRLADDELRGCGDAEFTALLSAYVDPGSWWADEPSWSRLRPGAAIR